MNIDSLLSRFKIQTKVLAFIFPFVISISAVGVLGLYATSLLQSSLTISNGVMTSLSGFRDVSASMNRFLEETTETNLSDVKTRLGEQKQILENTLDGLGDKTDGKDDLKTAIDTATDVENGMASLWQLQQADQASRKAINDAVSAIISAQLIIDEAGSQNDRGILTKEGTAKTALYDASRVANVNAEIAAIYAGYKAAGTAEEKLKFLSEALAKSQKTLRKLNSALPSDKKPLAGEIKDAFDTLKPIADAGVIEDTTLPALSAAMEKVHAAEQAIAAFNAPNLLSAIQSLADLEAVKVKADGIRGDSGRVSKSIYAVQIELAQFLAKPDKDTRDSLIQQFQIITKDMEALQGAAKGEKFFDDLTAKLVPAIDKMTTESAALVDINVKRMAAFESAAAGVDKIWGKLTDFAKTQKENAGVERERANQISITATLVGIVIAILAGIGLVATFKGPIGRITSAMRRLAEGALDTRIDGDARADEIGDMARALGVFKENALEKERMEQASSQQRAAAEQERARNEAEKRASEEQVAFAVNALASGLERLSKGDLTQEINTPFAGSLDRLRSDFNGSLVRLRETLTHIQTNAYSIQSNGAVMRSSADDLSRRTEAQAASLEQTAAAVDEITVTVRGSAERARDANTIVASTRKMTDESVVVVANAIDAMARIEDASGKIEQIIEVIDDIAFQTNLLALNAGIEAARAGEAGKGFAVVAQEVRELAQRSGGAAKEIKALIEQAASEVSSGVTHVQKTGQVLGAISGQITEISNHVNGIATAAQDQASALHEVNGSVNQMDQMTQANAAMVEESNALSQQLAEEADMLMQLVNQFRLVAGSAYDSRAA
ncbi:methyl-accepting chemotaxis protein [Rhizobium sp. PAMB 3182]